jgi:Tfp pilus assembly protein PilN
MINLLPPQHSAQIKYGRRNSSLRLWLIFTAVAIAVLIIIMAVGVVYINGQSKNLNHQIVDSQAQLKAQNLNQVQKDAKEISGDIKVINLVLNQELSFSALLQSIGGLMPARTVLTSLSLSSNVKSSVNLDAATVDPPAAAQIAVNISDPKQDLFSKVDIINVNCDQKKLSVYKCTATLQALFSKNAQKRFLNVPGASKP